MEAMQDQFPTGLKKKLLGLLDRQLAALEKLQDAGGCWHTVLDHPETYLETSVTAGIAYGVLKGIRLGLVDAKYAGMARRAMAAFIQNIDGDGSVLKGSGGTPVKENAAEYNDIPYIVSAFTQGLGLMALSEALREQSHRV
jgi:unsaturated rhamnogalacturonyl hydrolase